MTGVYSSFRIDGIGTDKNPRYPAGLFVLIYAAKDGETDAPSDPSQSELAFIGRFGKAHEVSAVSNPWALSLEDNGSKIAQLEKQMPARLFIQQPYFFCAVAHPSLTVARDLLKRVQAGQDVDGNGKAFPWQKIEPTKTSAGQLIFKLRGTKDDFIPGGPERYGGWLLYFGMPYEGLPDVHSQVKKLSVDLGNLKYPTGGTRAGGVIPYPANPSETGKAFDRMLQMCLHRFQEEATVGTARKPGLTGVISSWEAVVGTATKLAPLGTHESGVADQPTANALKEWNDQKVVRDAEPLVEDRQLWGNATLWWRQWAMEDLTKTLGALYEPTRGSSFRDVGAAGPGQAVQSKHKLGMAFDLNAHEAEPAKATPFGVEADFFPVPGPKDAPKTFRPRWLVFLHSTFRTSATPDQLRELRTTLSATPTRLREKMVEHMGPAFSTVAEAFLTHLKTLTDELVKQSETPGSSGAGTVLAEQFFRDTIRRFQWRENEDDGGDVQDESVTAKDDANANQLKGAATAASWVNYSRLAHRLGLFGIGARSDFCPPGFAQTKAAGKAIKLRPANSAAREQKATIMDRIADGIEKSNAPIKVFGPDDINFFAGEFKVSDFDLDVLRNWIRRPSDDPQKMPPATDGLSYASGGVDLTITVLFGGEGAAKQKAFMDSKKKLRVEVVAIGSGLTVADLKLNDSIELGVVAESMEAASRVEPSPKPVDGVGIHDIVVRPRFLKTQALFGKTAQTEKKGSDPGRYHFEVVPSGVPLSLEWWHQELDFDGMDWLARAETMGFSRAVLGAELKPDPSVTASVWQGGMGQSKGSNYGPPPEPAAAPQTPTMPVS